MAKNGTVAFVSVLPKCDFPHGSDVTPNPDAEYDFRTKDGRWGNGCRMHWLSYRMHSDLGVGKGQKLEVRTDG